MQLSFKMIITYPEYKDITVIAIQQCTARAMNVLLRDMLLSSRITGAKEKEVTAARQISMFLTIKYTNLSLGKIGKEHGGRKHATVLHAKKQINNLIDSNDSLIVPGIMSTLANIDLWHRKKGTLYRQITYCKPISTNRAMKIKYIIKNRVPLLRRQEILIKTTQL